MFVGTLSIDLPDCAMFPAEALSCPALNDSTSTNGTHTRNISGTVSTDRGMQCVYYMFQLYFSWV